MNHAILNDLDVCTSIVPNQPQDNVRWVKITSQSNAAVGRTWNGWTFDAPKWTSYEFLQRFTSQERRLVWSRAKQDDDIAEFLMFAQAANEVLSDDPATVAGMNLLVSKNILTASRKDQILNG